MFGPIYLDEIHYYDHGEASAAQLAAFASGQVDAIYEFDIASYAMAASIPNSMIYEAQTAQTGVSAHEGDQAAVRRPARPPRDPALLRCGRLSGARLPGPRHGRRAPPRGAGPPRILRAAADEARHRAGEEAAGRGRSSRRDRDQHRLRQHQRAVAAAGLRDPAGPAGPGRDQAQHQPDAGRAVLGDLETDPVRLHRLDASAAGHHGPVGGLPHRRALERDQVRQQGVRRGAGRGRRPGRRRAAPGGHGEGGEDPPGRGGDGAAAVADRTSSSPRRRCRASRRIRRSTTSSIASG